MEAYFPPNSTYGPHRMACSDNGICVFFSMDQIIVLELNPFQEICKVTGEEKNSNSSSWRQSNIPDTVTFPSLIPRCENNLCDGKFQSIEVSPNGDHVVTGDTNGEVALFAINLDSSERLFTKLKRHDGHKTGSFGKEKLSRVTALSWSKADPNIIVSGDSDGKLIAWSLSSNTVENYKLPGSMEVSVLRTHPSKKGITGAGFNKGLIMIFDVSDKFSVLMKTKASDFDIQDFSWRPFSQEEEDSNSRDKNTSRSEQDLQFVVGCKDQTVAICSLNSSKVIAYINHYDKNSKLKDKKYSHKGHRQISFWKTSSVILTNSVGGEILEWNIKKSENSSDRFTAYRSNAKLVCDGFKQVNGALMVGQSLLLVQSSLKTLSGVNFSTRNLVFNLPMFHILNCISPYSSLLAFGGSDIRLWKTDSQNVKFDVQTLWSQPATTVIDISWHPTKEGLLAFSTDNGQVGFLEALSQNKSVKFSSYHHKKEVYKLLWGPPIESDNSKPKTSLTVFSVGDFKLVQHPYLDKPAVVVNNLLKNQSGRDMKISQALFQQGDFKNLVVGYFDGTVEVFSYPELNRTCIIKSITKMITDIVWHPLYTGISTDPSPMRDFIAVASLHKNAYVIDLSEVLNDQAERPTTPVVTSVKTLAGHESTIFALCWSPYEDGRILTVARDNTAMVWDAISGVVLSVFQRHPRRLTSCSWHPSNSDLVITGSEDGSIYCWSVSSHPLSESKEVHWERRRKKKQTGSNQRELDDVLDVKKQHSQETLLLDLDDQINLGIQVEERIPPRKSKRQMNVFASAKAAMGRSDALLEDIESLTRLVICKEDEKEDLKAALNKTCTGVFFTDKKGADIALSQEINRLQQTQAPLEADVLRSFIGDYGPIVREAIQTSTITDWHVSLAAATGYGLYKEVCQAFGRQLAGSGFPVKGSSYFVMVGLIKEAIDLLVSYKEFPSAIVLARKRLPESSLALKEIFEAWALASDRDGRSLESIRPNLALGNLTLAAQSIARSENPNLLKLATTVSKLGGNLELTRLTSIHCASTCLTQGEWDILEELCKEVDYPEVHDIRAKANEKKIANLDINAKNN